MLPLLALVTFVVGLAGWLEERGEASVGAGPVAGSVVEVIQRAAHRLPAHPSRHVSDQVARGAVADTGPPPDASVGATADSVAAAWGSGEIDTTWDASSADRERLAALAAAHFNDPQAEPWVVRWALVAAGEPVVDAEEVATAAERVYADPRVGRYGARSASIGSRTPTPLTLCWSSPRR